jgi:hypothetical protein
MFAVYSQALRQARCKRSSLPKRQDLAGTFTNQNHLCSLQEDNHIQKQTVVFEIVEIVLQLFLGVINRRPVRIAQLRPTRNPWFDSVTLVVERNLFP